MAANTKYSPQGDQGHSEIFATNASKMTDWAEEQYPNAPQASVANSNQYVQVRKSSTLGIKLQQQQQQQQQQTNFNHFTPTQQSTETYKPQKLTCAVYDIPTLLKLRNEIDGKRLELRVSPAALAGKLQHCTCNIIIPHLFGFRG